MPAFHKFALAHALLLRFGKFASVAAQQWPSAAPSLRLSPIASAYIIEAVEGGTDVAFNSTRAASEVITRLRVSRGNIGELVDPIKIHDFESCGDFSFDQVAIAATANFDFMAIDGPYATFPVAIDLNTTDINKYQGRADYPGFFATNAANNTATIKFCLKPELGTTAQGVLTDQDGNPATSSISYTKIKFMININMEQGFDTANITVAEEAPEEENQSAEIDYECK